MGAKSTRGATMCVVKGSATPNAMTVVSASKANPPEIGVADVTGLKVGTIVTFKANSTGLESLDGKSFIIGSVDGVGNTFTVLGVSTVNDTGTFAAGADIDTYDDAAMQCLCLNQFEISVDTPDTISVATFCEPSATLPSSTTAAGTITIGGYVDKDDPGYIEMLAADLDGASRMWRIMMPQDNGYLIFPATVAGLGYQFPLDGGQAWTASLILGSKPRHLF